MTASKQDVGTVVSDLQQKIIYVDDQYVDIVGRYRVDILDRQALSFTYPADSRANQPRLDRLVSDGPGFIITKRYVRGDGSVVWVRNHVTRIKDGGGKPLLCATTERAQRPFGNDRLARNYETVRLLCQGLISGRELLSLNVVWAPAIEALLWLYRAESDGASHTVDHLAALIGNPSSATVRWMRLLHDHRLIVIEGDEPLHAGAHVRISQEGERKIDTLLAGMPD